MARLTEREVDLIQRARRENPKVKPASAQQLIEEAQRPRAEYMAAKIRHGLQIVARTTGLAAAARAVDAGIVHPVRQGLVHRRTVNELRRLDDHLLQDVGLTRDAIENFGSHMAETRLPAPQSRPSLWARLGSWWRRRVTISKLEALDDRMLADIGLTRGTIIQAVDALAAATTPEESAAPARSPMASHDTMDALRQWNLSRQAAAQMARLGPDVLGDLGYVKGDVDWVPEVLAKRQLHRRPAQ